MSHYMEMSFLTTYSLILIFPIFYNIGIMDANAIECENLKICVYDWRLPINGMRFMPQNLGEGVSLHKDIHPPILRVCRYISTIKLRGDLVLKTSILDERYPLIIGKRFLFKVDKLIWIETLQIPLISF